MLSRKQTIQNRYYDHNGPVAQKVVAEHADNQNLSPPEDSSIVRPYTI
jgi:pre-mRNA-splicing factor RBM22/SLT11